MGRSVRLEDGAYGGRNARRAEKGLCGRGAAKQMEGEQAMKYIADFLVRDVQEMPKKGARTVYVPEVKRKVLTYFARLEAVLCPCGDCKRVPSRQRQRMEPAICTESICQHTWQESHADGGYTDAG